MCSYLFIFFASPKKVFKEKVFAELKLYGTSSDRFPTDRANSAVLIAGVSSNDYLKVGLIFKDNV